MKRTMLVLLALATAALLSGCGTMRYGAAHPHRERDGTS